MGRFDMAENGPRLPDDLIRRIFDNLYQYFRAKRD